MPEAEEISWPGPAQKPASSFSIFGRSWPCLFARLFFLITCSVVPCPLLMALSHFYTGWTVIGGDN
jgi:hypothetical protein